MSLIDHHFRKVPDYYPTMYMDGFTPEEIHYARRKKFRKDIQDRELRRRIAELEKALEDKGDGWDLNIHIKEDK